MRLNTNMLEKHFRPTFKPKPFMDGSGWHVDAEWPDGVTQHVDDFGSGSEAREWIAKKSEGWLQKHPIPKQPELSSSTSPIGTLRTNRLGRVLSSIGATADKGRRRG